MENAEQKKLRDKNYSEISDLVIHIKNRVDFALRHFSEEKHKEKCLEFLKNAFDDCKELDERIEKARQEQISIDLIVQHLETLKSLY